MGKIFQVHGNMYPLDFNIKTFEYSPDRFRSKCRHTYIHTDILIQIPPRRRSSNTHTHTRTHAQYKCRHRLLPRREQPLGKMLHTGPEIIFIRLYSSLVTGFSGLTMSASQMHTHTCALMHPTYTHTHTTHAHTSHTQTQTHLTSPPSPIIKVLSEL